MKVTVSEKGRIVIPIELRRKLKIERGSKLEVRSRGKVIEIEQLPKHPILSLRGKLKGKTSLNQELVKTRKRDRARGNAK